MSEFPAYPAVLRFPIPIDGYGSPVTIPSAHTILSVAPGRGSDYHIDVWIECQPSHHDETVIFEVFGTGHKLPKMAIGSLEFIGTCVMSDDLVWHVYHRSEGSIKR